LLLIAVFSPFAYAMVAHSGASFPIMLPMDISPCSGDLITTYEGLYQE
jgi:hypothetical protein